MRIRTVRKSLAVASAATLLVLLSSCSPAQSDTGPSIEIDPDAEVEIVFESYNLARAGVWTDTITALIDEFEADHPNITITTQAVDVLESVQSVQTQAVAGKAPDVSQLTFDGLDFAVNQLGAVSLTDLVGADALNEHLGGEYPMHERARTLGDWDGETFGLPYVFSTPVLFYNVDTLAAAGIKDPDLSTWESVEEVARQVTAKTGEPTIGVQGMSAGGGWQLQGILASNGAQVLSDDRSAIKFGSSASAETLEYFQSMAEEGLLANADTYAMQDNFASGRLPMLLFTAASVDGLKRGAAAGGWELGAAAMPGFKGKAAVPTNSGSALFIFSEDPQKQAAGWEFIKFLTSAHSFEMISSKIGYPPLRTTMVEKGGPLYDWYEQDPLVHVNVEQIDHLQPWVSYPGPNFQQVDRLLTESVESVVFQGADAGATLQTAASRAQELIEK